MRKSIGHPVLMLLAAQGLRGEVVIARRFPRRVVVKVSARFMTFYIQTEVDRRGNPVHGTGGGASIRLHRGEAQFGSRDVALDWSKDLNTQIALALMEKTARDSWCTWGDRPFNTRLLSLRAYDDRMYGFVQSLTGETVRFDMSQRNDGDLVVDGETETTPMHAAVYHFINHLVDEVSFLTGLRHVNVASPV